MALQSGLAATWSEALQTVSRATTGEASQRRTQQAWGEIVAEGTARQIPEILSAMSEGRPLADNWLRAAADTIAERELRVNGTLPTAELETFVLDLRQPARGRRVAYEWLRHADPTTPQRLLPQMLDDPSLALRFDAIERLLAEAKEQHDLEGPALEAFQLKKYQRALRSARDVTQWQTCAEALKELGQAPNMAKQLGFVTAWKVIGPFDNTDRAGFDKVYAPEQAIDLEGEFTGKHGRVKWKDALAELEDLKDLGKVDLNGALAEEKSVLAYAMATFQVAHDLQVECRYESLEATKLWINGHELAAENVYHSGDGFDQYIVPCQFQKGENQILIKVCQNEQTDSWTKPWDFRLRITDQLGGAILPVDATTE